MVQYFPYIGITRTVNDPSDEKPPQLIETLFGIYRFCTVTSEYKNIRLGMATNTIAELVVCVQGVQKIAVEAKYGAVRVLPILLRIVLILSQ